MSVPQGYHVRFVRWLAADFPVFARLLPRGAMVIGPAKVLDGDTIEVAGLRIRLHGIDAPEMDQIFKWKGRFLASGEMSFAALEALIAGVRVRCVGVEWDCYGRLVAKCYSPNGVDINRRMVASGWALAYRRYSNDYVEAERIAKRFKRGMWRGTFIKPWEHRAEQARKARGRAAAG
jgi:endonuclease YncB( thermonuclease family)